MTNPNEMVSPIVAMWRQDRYRRTRELLDLVGAIQTGHFLLSSGLHSDHYVQCSRLFEFPVAGKEICQEMAGLYQGGRVDVVVGPALGSIIMSYEVARGLGVRSIFAERENGKLTLRRGFYVNPNTRVLVVEDVVTTGESVRELIKLIEEKGAEIAGVGAVVDRTDGNVDFGVPFRSMMLMEHRTWEASECPLCREGVPFVKPGSRAVQDSEAV